MARNGESVMPRFFVRRRAWPAALAALAVLFSMLAAWQTSPAAKAESGRRLCWYVKGKIDQYVTVQDPATKGNSTKEIPAKLNLVLDYKKDGECPWVPDPYQLKGDVRHTYGHPEPKDDCERLYVDMNADGVYLGASHDDLNYDLGLEKQRGSSNWEGTDPCPKMRDDQMYAFYVFQDEHTYWGWDRTQRKWMEMKTQKGDFMSTALGNPNKPKL